MKVFSNEEANTLSSSEKVITKEELKHINGRRPTYEEIIQLRSNGLFRSKDFNLDKPNKVILLTILWVICMATTYIGIVKIPFVLFDEHVPVGTIVKFVYFVLIMAIIDMELTHYLADTFIEQRSRKLRKAFDKDDYEIIIVEPEGYIFENGNILKQDTDKLVVRIEGTKFGVFENIEGEFNDAKECIAKDGAALLRFKIYTNFGRTEEHFYVVYVFDKDEEAKAADQAKAEERAKAEEMKEQAKLAKKSAPVPSLAEFYSPQRQTQEDEEDDYDEDEDDEDEDDFIGYEILQNETT